MAKKRKKTRSRRGLQVVTLCISTAMVLVLLGLVVFSVLTARNLSAYVKENLTVTVVLAEDITNPEAEKMCRELQQRPYVSGLTYISKEEALKELTKEMGADPTEFLDGYNPTLASVEMQMRADYANRDSLKWIETELKKNAKVQEITYPKDLMDQVNRTLAKINFVLLVLAVLLLIISFSLINNSIKLGVYARRFSIHTMKLVGASWGFIRWPFLRRSIVIGVLAALLALLVLGGCVYALYNYDPDVLTVITWQDMCITAVVVLVAGVLITFLCSYFSVNKFLRMKAGELYKI
ncbi:MAG: permease-like cell division protein FtsX [Prevotella sp.]|nr:permease-like cell division protein FtsX [Prevotella sp.]